MTSRLNLLFAIMVMALFITGCSKQMGNAEGLTGTWEWKSTDGGLANHLHQTPSTTGIKEQLKLTNGLQYIRYKDGFVTEEGTYTLSEKACIHDKKLKSVIQFSDAAGALMVENVDPQQLILSDEHFDGLEIRYERKNLKDN